MLTPEEYVEKGGLLCPICESEEIEGHSGDFGTEACQKMSCNECEAIWYDTYKLTGFFI
jgi:hypothetical protein